MSRRQQVESLKKTLKTFYEDMTRKLDALLDGLFI